MCIRDSAISALLGLISAAQIKMDLAEMVEGTNSALSEFEQRQQSLVGLGKKCPGNGDASSSSSDSDSDDDKKSGEKSSSDSSDSDSDGEASFVRTRAQNFAQQRRVEELGKNFGGFEAGLDGFVGNNHNDGQWKDAYDRVLPGNYEANEEHAHVDTFTRNVL